MHPSPRSPCKLHGKNGMSPGSAGSGRFSGVHLSAGREQLSGPASGRSLMHKHDPSAFVPMRQTPDAVALGTASSADGVLADDSRSGLRALEQAIPKKRTK